MKQIAALLIVLFGCASNNREARLAALQERGDPAHPLFVGHSDTGEIVIAASHFDAMSGLAVTASEVGEKGGERMLCARQMLTGTHVPKWICRYQSDVDDEHLKTQNYLDAPRNSLGITRGVVFILATPPPS